MSEFGAIVVGGGHNGLVAAAYLARSGVATLVIEADDVLGGPAGTREFLPGYRGAVTNSPGSFEPRIVQDLDLHQHGLEFQQLDPTLIHPLEGGRLFVGYRDRTKTLAQLDAFAPGDGARYTALFDHLQDFADRIGVSLFGPPPTLASLVGRLTTPEDQTDFARLLWGSASELARRYLRSPEAQAIVTTLATAGGPGSPSIPGTNMNLLMRPFSLTTGGTVEGYDPRKSPLRGSTGLPIGGMGAIVTSIERSFTSAGGTVIRGARVARIRTVSDRVVGVTAEDGTEYDAPIVISAVDPKITIGTLMLDDPGWSGFRDELQPGSNIQGACKVVLALSGLPRWHDNGIPAPAEYSYAQFRIAPTEQYLEDCYAACLQGDIPRRPVLFGLIPSATSPGMAPEGHHIMSLNLEGPRKLARGTWEQRKGEVIANCIDALLPWMPDLPGLVVDARCISPDDFVADFGLVDAEISHGEMLPGNMFWTRPMPGLSDYRTPTAGLYLSGAGTWPGNYVSGVPGYNTASVVLSDLREARTTA